MKQLHNFFGRLTIMALSLVALSAWCAPPANYYKDLNGKTGAELKTAAHKIINPHTIPSSYSTYYTNLRETFQKTDLYPDSRRWWDMYSDIPFYAPSFNGLNREHSFPKSWWGGAENVPPYVDLYHLYPSERAANTAKLNYPLGEVTSTTFDNGISKVGAPRAGLGGGASRVFEPDDEYKGDFARTYFYMVTCYQQMTWKYTYMTQNNTYPTMQPWAVNMLLEWAKNDPVSQKELDRNEAVYKIQNNRNPFIDFPMLADYIWGDKKGELFYTNLTPEEPVGDPVLLSPVDDMSLDFGDVAVGNTTSSLLNIRGENIKNQVSVVISGTDRAMFSASEMSINPEFVNTADGFQLKISYKPTSVGEHTAKLSIFDFDNSGKQVTVTLRGNALPVPTLTALTATAPTDVKSDSYVANWSVPAETVDYYIVTRTRYVNGTSEVTELLAEQNSLEINGFDTSDSESYSVQSVRLGYRSPMSNVIFVGHSGIAGVNDDNITLEVVIDDNMLTFIGGAGQTNCCVYDVAGRLVRTIPVLAADTAVSLPAGVFFIVTDQHRRPVKVIVN